MKKHLPFDLNEEFHRLPKEKQKDWLMDVVINYTENSVEATSKSVQKRTRAQKGQWEGLKRFWRRDFPGASMTMPGKRYRINKSWEGVYQPNSKRGHVWRHLLEAKNDTITVEGLRSLIKGQGLDEVATMATLYSIGQIDPVKDNALDRGVEAK